MREMLDSTELLREPEALRSRAQRDGYVLVREALPPDDVSRVGEEMGGVMARAGWIETEAPLAEARVNLEKRCVEPQPAFMEVFYSQLSCKSLHALKMHTNPCPSGHHSF